MQSFSKSVSIGRKRAVLALYDDQEHQNMMKPRARSTLKMKVLSVTLRPFAAAFVTVTVECMR